MDRDIWVLVEQDDGSPTEASLELLTSARRLADELGAKVGAVILGREVARAAEPLIQCGADRIFIVENQKFTQYTTDGQAIALVDLLGSRQPRAMLFPETRRSRDLAPKIAARMAVSLVANCSSVAVSRDGSFTASRPVVSRRAEASIEFKSGSPHLVLLRQRTADLPIPDLSRHGEVLNIEVEIAAGAIQTREIALVKTDPSEVDIAEAEVIVAAGRGVGGADGLRLVRELADCLGAPVVGSRPLVDAGLLGRDGLVGQSGRTVSPRLYIACGISGAPQHVMAIKDARKIVAINIDPKAPIFGIANVGIVADLRVAIPEVLRQLQTRSR